ncbi:hypothetical protein F2Q68_00028332 [Brassica cretica]|uniref:Uncharacterized protein n=1 Tax=Brassica cretica TaxID=69181 RepID=A0A8S9IJG1_BRACR|nr:hypothetical protein F2Q68_00028332 [Brassica cretica]
MGSMILLLSKFLDICALINKFEVWSSDSRVVGLQTPAWSGFDSDKRWLLQHRFVRLPSLESSLLVVVASLSPESSGYLMFLKWLSRRYAQPTQILAAFDALIPDEFVSGGSSELRLEFLVGGGLETTVFSLTRVCFHKVGVHVVAAGQVASFLFLGVG